MSTANFLTLSCTVLASLAAAGAVPSPLVARDDPCAAIAKDLYVAPADVRACFTSFPIDPAIKSNIVEVLNKTLAFHASTNYQRQTPAPFENDVHVDVPAELARISQTEYANDFELHQDISLVFRRLQDGHALYLNQCYDSLFLSVLPTPLVLLTNESGEQYVHIDPEAFKVSTGAFGSEIEFWQNALPDSLKGQLESFSGARVLEINGEDPFVAVDEEARTSGTFQGLGARQTTFFSSYSAGPTGWQYRLGGFAQMALPLVDSVTLKVQRIGSNDTDTITLPYRSRRSSNAPSWTDSNSFWKNNCVAQQSTNGINLYNYTSQAALKTTRLNPATKFRQAPIPADVDTRKATLNVMLDRIPLQDVSLPEKLVPQDPQSGSASVVLFYMLKDGKTGVLALGDFVSLSELQFQQTLLNGLQNLKGQGATQLIVDVTNNSGGYVCVAHYLHRILAGPKATTEPLAGLFTVARAGVLAKLITEKIADGADPNNFLFYNSNNWSFKNSTHMPSEYDWLEDDVPKVVNGVQDAFSQTLGDERCQPFAVAPPNEPLFDTNKVAIVSNGRCASSCSLFSIAMAKQEGAKTVVYGGKKDVKQQYCGVVGGQSTDFTEMDSELKTTGLKDHPLAPPDFLSNSVQGVVWRLGLGIDNPAEPEEWQDHPADVNLPVTLPTVNNPVAIWEDVVKAVF